MALGASLRGYSVSWGRLGFYPAEGGGGGEFGELERRFAAEMMMRHKSDAGILNLAGRQRFPEKRGATVMFRRSLPYAILVFCNCGLVDARIVQPWSYAKLNQHADVVAIVSVKSTEAFDEPFDTTKLGGPEMVGRLTAFEVKTVLKGQLADNNKELKLVHFKVSEKEKTIVNGPRLPAFRTGQGVGITPHYLLFLKARKDGKFEPVSGQVDSAYSVVLLKPELTPVEIEDE